MIRARFHVPSKDFRPVNWPIKHPYWCTGYGEGYAILVAYADDEDGVLLNWPDAENIDSDSVEDYVFTDRFPRPEWFKDQP